MQNCKLIARISLLTALIFTLCAVSAPLLAAGKKSSEATKSSRKTTKQKSTRAKTSSAAKKLPAEKVNINTATVEELIQLPGIGEVKAKSILKYRKMKGKITDASQLAEVDGIGAKTVEKLKPYLKF